MILVPLTIEKEELTLEIEGSLYLNDTLLALSLETEEPETKFMLIGISKDEAYKLVDHLIQVFELSGYE